MNSGIRPEVFTYRVRQLTNELNDILLAWPEDEEFKDTIEEEVFWTMENEVGEQP